MSERAIHVLTDQTREWAFTIEPDHIAQAREIEQEYTDGGRDAAKDRVEFVYHHVARSDTPHPHMVRFASAMAICMVDDALRNWHQNWDGVTGAMIRINKNTEGGFNFAIDTLRAADGSVH